MIALTQFLEVVLAGVALIAMTIAVGGVCFVLSVLPQAGRDSALLPSVLARALRAIFVAACVVALTRVAALLLIAPAFLDDAGKAPLADLLSTTFAQATIAYAATALALACAARTSAFPGSGSRTSIGVYRRLALIFTALIVLVTGAWLTHAASRVDNAAELMTVTVLHQLGAAIWVGGIAHLALAWPLVRTDALWPRLLARFSPLALASVLLLSGGGVYLAWRYVGDWAALIGTGYGAMVLAKAALLAVALGLAYLNFSAVRGWRARRDTAGITGNVPAYVQAELAVVATALLTAASLTSQAPAADVQTERAEPKEVLAFFAPKAPLLVPPARDTYLASANSTADPFAVAGAVERAQNTFNHNLSGLLVLAIGLAAALDRTRRVALARHWPLLFIPLAVFVLLYAEPTVWPLGPEGFWATLAVPAVLQHRLAALLVVALGVGEWRVRVGGLGETRWRYAFPILCAAGGAMLLTHSHTVFATKSEFLIELSHAVLGFLALMTGVARWLELRLAQPQARAMGAASAACLIAVGLVLLFYREA